MPDNIAQLNGQRMMAYQGAKPWHSFGTIIEDPATATVRGVLKLAHMDWDVELMPMYISNLRREQISHGDHLWQVNNRRAVVRRDGSTPVILGTVGDAYNPLQNIDAFSVLDTAMREFGVQIETAGALGNGERVWMLAKLPYRFDIVDGDTIESYFLIASGHDGATPYTGRPTPTRVVCQNTLEIAFAHTEAIIRLTHTQKIGEHLKLVERMVADLMRTMDMTRDTFRQLAARKLNALEVRQYIDTVLGIEDGSLISGIIKRRRDNIVELAYRGKGTELAPETLWTAYNAVTEYVDHVRPAEAKSEKRRRNANESALFGANAVLKARALRIAEEMVE